jgi:hypothetical protein
MLKVLISIAVLLLTAQNSDAQYSLMKRGELCPFDTAVAIHIDMYRVESEKLILCDTLVSGLWTELSLMRQKEGSLLDMAGYYARLYALREEDVKLKDETIVRLNLNFSDLEKKYRLHTNFWQKNKGWIGFAGGIIVSGVIVYTLR